MVQRAPKSDWYGSSPPSSERIVATRSMGIFIRLTEAEQREIPEQLDESLSDRCITTEAYLSQPEARVLVAMVEATRIEAARGLQRRQDYRCPSCGNPVVLHARVGGWVIPHFKHKADSACSYGKGETAEHRAVKALLRDHYRAKGYHVEVEHDIADRRADVFVPDLKVAFEVEFSPKEVREFVAKCRDYQNSDVKSVWVIKQKDSRFVSVQEGDRILISVSRVLDFIYSKHRPRGARPAFFAYSKDAVVVFRGIPSSQMLYKEYDEYSGAGGYEYPSKSKMWLKITDVIRLESPAPKFPGADGAHPVAPPRNTQVFYGAEAA